MGPPLCRTASQSQNGCGIMGRHVPAGGVSPMVQKMSVFGINMAKLVLHIAGVARRYPIFTSYLENANFRQNRPYRRAFTPPYADTP
jgi:hypothetical protein